MKTCTNCKEQKSLDEFQKRARSKDGHTNLCKPCKREYDNAHYKSHPSRREYITKNRAIEKEKATKFIYDYLLKHPCVDCGENDVVVLEFDHVRDKRNSVATLRSSSLKAVQEEIEKCEVRCANCHRRKTAKQFGWTTRLATLA